MEKFKNKYRIPSARAQWWDYGNNAAYFITICTKNRCHFFGKITDERLLAYPAGDIAANIWYEIPSVFPYAQLGAFVVMPNHIHGIVIIEKTVSGVAVPLHPATKPQAGGFAGSNNPVLNENLSRIVRWYKGRCSFEIRKVNPVFQWQTRFHDHIIRNDATYQRINDYIENNPANWCKDKFSEHPTLP
ncbi:MAG: hypothetical protein RLZ62_2379 [Bacteroidota bacterium]|jgi:REP element-mobilizing transposase RayT